MKNILESARKVNKLPLFIFLNQEKSEELKMGSQLDLLIKAKYFNMKSLSKMNHIANKH